jgi:ABC-type sugar transport system ATPase subunit
MVFDSGKTIPIPERLAQSRDDLPKKAIFGFRPEDVELGGSGIGLGGEILAVEALGFQSVISMRTDEGDVKILSTDYRPGESGRITFSVPEEKIHLFSGSGNKAWHQV